MRIVPIWWAEATSRGAGLKSRRSEAPRKAREAARLVGRVVDRRASTSGVPDGEDLARAAGAGEAGHRDQRRDEAVATPGRVELVVDPDAARAREAASGPRRRRGSRR